MTWRQFLNAVFLAFAVGCGAVAVVLPGSFTDVDIGSRGLFALGGVWAWSMTVVLLGERDWRSNADE